MSRRSTNQPLSISKASNSLLFTSQATRSHLLSGPAPEPIGKRISSEVPSRADVATPTSAEILLARKSKERSGVSRYGYDLPSPGVRTPRSRPSSIRSSRRSSIRSGRTRPNAIQRKQSIETVRSRLSIGSSMSTSHLSGRFSRLIIEEPASLTNVPTELVHCIAQYLSRSDILNLVLVSKQINAETTVLLYSKPYFTSTYRFAQFVTTISHNPRLAELVQELDLSHFSKLSKDLALAGWREWKYRTESLYTLYPGDADPIQSNKHPPPHPLLAKYSTGGHDVPLGALMHIVKACPRLRIVDLNNLHISADYVILPSAPPPRWKPLIPSLHKPPTYHPTAFTNELFISDVPKSHTWRGAEFRTLKYEEFVDALCCLPDLESLALRRAVWLKRVFAEEIVRRAGGEQGLRRVNFTACGMTPRSSWTKKWVARRNESIRSLIIFDSSSS